MATTKQIDIAAECMGVRVPRSPFLTEKRIERINAGRYEGQEIRGALHLVREGDRVLELGAGLGIVGAVVAKQRKPARLLAFEANPALVPHINALYKANALTRRNKLRNAVLVSAPDRPETLPFAVHNSFLGSSLTGDAARAREMVDVPTESFAAVAADLDPHVMLMDIEGGELELLRHADLSAMTALRGIVIEFHPGAYDVSGMRECKNIMRAAGFARIDDLSSRTVWVAERQPPAQADRARS